MEESNMHTPPRHVRFAVDKENVVNADSTAATAMTTPTAAGKSPFSIPMESVSKIRDRIIQQQQQQSTPRQRFGQVTMTPTITNNPADYTVTNLPSSSTNNTPVLPKSASKLLRQHYEQMSSSTLHRYLDSGPVRLEPQTPTGYDKKPLISSGAQRVILRSTPVAKKAKSAQKQPRIGYDGTLDTPSKELLRSTTASRNQQIVKKDVVTQSLHEQVPLSEPLSLFPANTTTTTITNNEPTSFNHYESSPPRDMKDPVAATLDNWHLESTTPKEVSAELHHYVVKPVVRRAPFR